MPPPHLPALQRLQRLDRSSSEFHDQLCNVFYGEEYQKCVPNLEGDDLVWLVEYLDNAFDGLERSSPAFRKCLRELKNVCGIGGILPTSYTLLDPLLDVETKPSAEGGFGDVYCGTLDGSKVCVKRIRIYAEGGPEEAFKLFCREAVMWKKLTHRNILPLMGITTNPLQLISSWMPGGELPGYIKGHADADRLLLISDVAIGLSYLHSCNVIHGDLKGRNILIDGSRRARIADFGLAMVTQNPDSIKSDLGSDAGTPRWSAPEIIRDQTFSKESDIFSFAMVMIEVFTGAIPFSNIVRGTAAMVAIVEGRRPPRPKHPTFADGLWTLMQRCWDQDPHLRPEVSDVVQVLFTAAPPAWKQLISYPLSADERASLMTSIFSDLDQIEVVRKISRDDTQAFVDVIDEGSDSLAPEIHIRCLRYLTGICVHHTLLPNQLKISVDWNANDGTHEHFYGNTDIFKGKYRGQDVAVRALIQYTNADPQEATKKFYRMVIMWNALRHPNVLALMGVVVTETHLATVSEWTGNVTLRGFIKAHPDRDRVGLLRDVTRGILYIHGRGMIHGNLMCPNVLVDQTGHVRLAGFHMISIIPDPTDLSSSNSHEEDTAVRWASPELFDDGQRTKSSDCYALGMVIYETISRRLPFYHLANAYSIILCVSNGERPRREMWYTDSLWGMLERCWEQQPDARPNVEDVLRCLEMEPPCAGRGVDDSD